MKTTKEDFDNAAKNKKEVKFGKSTTYAVDEEQIKQIGEKDISEGGKESNGSHEKNGGMENEVSSNGQSKGCAILVNESLDLS